jgi:hypothetical protein
MNEKYKIKEETISQLRHELEFALAKDLRAKARN